MKVYNFSFLFSFFTLQLTGWVDELRQELQQDEIAENLETAERLLEQCAQHRTSCLEACASTIAQGEALLQELRDSTEMPDTTGSVRFSVILYIYLNMEFKRM